MVTLYPVKVQMEKADNRFKNGYRIDTCDVYCEYKNNDTTGIPCIRFLSTDKQKIVKIL
jgi:hypothetical protein